jgi:heme/copper-type cytochrome/quinol oxidase subunit 2
MLNFNGGTTISGTSLSPLGMYAGYLLMQAGNFWLAVCFLALTVIYVLIVITTLCRYIINYRRNKQALDYKPV